MQCTSIFFNSQCPFLFPYLLLTPSQPVPHTHSWSITVTIIIILGLGSSNEQYHI
jgi:aspartokinase-like uncharacterized kinase